LFNFYGLTFAGITIEEFWIQKNIFKNVTQLILQVVLVNALKAITYSHFYFIKTLTVTNESLGKKTLILGKTNKL
jgi:hypothetical protein